MSQQFLIGLVLGFGICLSTVPAQQHPEAINSNTVVAKTPQKQDSANEVVPDVLEKISDAVQQLCQRHKDALVRVRTTTSLGIFHGTGFLIDAQGHIVTSSSLVPDNGQVLVRKDDVEVIAEVVGLDRPSSIALLKAQQLSNHNSLHFRQGTALEAGSAVVILGFPYNKNPSPLFALIDSHDRVLPDGRMLCVTHLRMNVPIIPGMIGSPVLDSSGQVVGMVTGTANEGRLTYALSTPFLRRVLSELSQHGKVRRGWIGVELEESRLEPGAPSRLVVSKVHPNTPAHSAGVQPGDILQRIGDRIVQDRFDVIEAAFLSYVGQQVPIFVQRNHQQLVFHLAVVERPDEIPFVEVRKPSSVGLVFAVSTEEN